MKKNIVKILLILLVLLSPTVVLASANDGVVASWEIREDDIFECNELFVRYEGWITSNNDRVSFMVYDSNGRQIISDIDFYEDEWLNDGAYYPGANGTSVRISGNFNFATSIKESGRYTIVPHAIRWSTKDRKYESVKSLNELYLDVNIIDSIPKMKNMEFETNDVYNSSWIKFDLYAVDGFGYDWYFWYHDGSGHGSNVSSISGKNGNVYNDIGISLGAKETFEDVMKSTYSWSFGNISVSGNTAAITISRPVNLNGKPYVYSNRSASTAAPSDYLYNAKDPGASVVLDPTLLASVTDQATAVKAIETQASRLTTEQKQSATGIDLMTLFAAEAISGAASQTVSGGSITIDQSNVQALQNNAASTKTAAEKALSSAGIAVDREMDETVKFKTDETGSVTITVDSSVANTTADNVRIETPEYAITLSKEMIAENTADSPLIITITESNFVAMFDGEGYILVAAAKGKSYDVKFNKTIKEDVKISLPSPDGDNSYVAVFDEGGQVKGGKYNPAIDKVEARINTSGTYTTKENRKDFSDIQSKSAEMQEAIKILAAKGIISGASPTEFSPDAPITRAEIAALITRTLSKLDANADGGFSDVKSNEWFFGAAGSAKRHGIMAGTAETVFSPNVNIPKDQIVAVAARVLKTEQGYRVPNDSVAYLAKYSDNTAIADWAKSDVALATKLNLVVQRTDGSFSPATTMTRGDAAIILYRMFMKIW